jgi:hypothetical protein
MESTEIAAGEEYFSSSYEQARSRFRAQAGALGAVLESMEIPSDALAESLTIDGAWLGDPEAKQVLLVTSGIHGVEGFTGSALQAALMQRWSDWRHPSVAWCLLHVLNPYGMHHGRRWNAHNVDLNRNFHRGDVQTHCEDVRVRELHEVIGGVATSDRPARWWSLARLVAELGLSRTRQVIAEGQFFYPEGLFYGGREVQVETQRVREYLDRRLGRSSRILHIDVHTGLGRHGEASLFMHFPESHPRVREVEAIFGRDMIKAFSGVQTTFKIHGGFIDEIPERFQRAKVTALTLEFGVRSPLAILRALRRENQATHDPTATPQARQRAREQLRSCFVSERFDWRRRCVRSGMEVFRRGHAALCADASP